MNILYRRTVAVLSVFLVHCTLADGAAIAPKCLYSVTEASQETKVKPEKVVTVSADDLAEPEGNVLQ